MSATNHASVLGRAVALAAFVAVLLLAAAGVAQAAGRSVVIRESGGQFHFVPSSVTVTVGQSVTWSNHSTQPHTVTSDSAGGPLNASLDPDGADYTATFRKVGVYRYHCNIHPYMHGVVHVDAAHVAPHPAPRPAVLPPSDATGLVTGMATSPGQDEPGIGTQAVIGTLAVGAAGWLTFVRRRRALRP